MKISIITPVFNGERWIRGCLENVIAQGVDDIEHIVMDGCSTDRTISIAREIASRHPHIRVISEPDKGQSHAMNKAIRLARADYIGILNVDDFYEPGTLNRVIDLIDRTPEPTMFIGNVNMVDEAGGITCVRRPELDIDTLLLGSMRSAYATPCNPSSYFYPAQFHEQVGYYDEREHYVMDVRFLFSALPCTRTAYFDEVWGNYRFIPGTKTFDDMVAGRTWQRMRPVIFSHYLKRPLRRKLRIAARAVLWPIASRRRRRLAVTAAAE